VTPIDRYLEALAAALRVSGSARRRILSEVADHLHESAERHGEAEAAARFGDPAALAAEFDRGVAAGRSRRALAWVTAALLVAGAVTLDIAHTASGDGGAPALLVLAFWVGSQVAAVALACSLVQALRGAHETSTPALLALQGRRHAVALAGAVTAVLSAALIAGGSATRWEALGALALLAGAGGAAWRAGRLAHRLPGGADLRAASPLDDVVALAAPVPPAAAALRLLRDAVDPVAHPVRASAGVVAVAAAAAFARDHGEGASVGRAALTAAIEAAAVLGAFGLLGPALGLRRA
jgi:HAAS domain-containing protein